MIPIFPLGGFGRNGRALGLLDWKTDHITLLGTGECPRDTAEWKDFERRVSRGEFIEKSEIRKHPVKHLIVDPMRYLFARIGRMI